MKATTFDRSVCKELGTKVEAILKEALKDSGFNIIAGGGRFEDLEFTMKVKFTFADGETKAHKDYREHAALPYTSFPPDILDSTFPYGRAGHEVTVLGWLPNRPKMDILLRDSKGKDKVAPSESIIRAYERKFGKYIKPTDEVKGTLIETAPPSVIPAMLKG
jgi:hypothetical protein